MTCEKLQTPVLTEQQMANFLMNHYGECVTEKVKNEYRTRSLAYLETIHGPDYAQKVRKLMESMYRGGRNANRT